MGKIQLILMMIFTTCSGLHAQIQRPQNGHYRIIHDSSQIKTVVWDILCAEKPKAQAFSQSDRVTLHHYAKNKWWIDGGKKLRIGSNICYAKNPSTKVISSQNSNQSWSIRCASTRITKGTEKETHLLTAQGSELELNIQYDHDLLKDSAHCHYNEHRILRFKYIQPKKKTQHPIIMNQEELSKELEQEALQAISNIPQGHLKIRIQNLLDSEFIPLKQHYFLDGTELLAKDQKQFPKIQSKKQLQIYQDLLYEGIHTFEIHSSFRVKDTGRFFTLTLKKQLIFELDNSDRKELKIQIFFDNKIFEDRTKRVHIRFLIDNILQQTPEK